MFRRRSRFGRARYGPGDISSVAAGLEWTVGGQLIVLCTHTGPPTRKALAEPCEIAV